MTNILLPGNPDVNNRRRLYRSDQQPNLLEYIDTTLNESFSLDLTLTRAITNGYDQFGNTIVDQYLVYLLCQKLNPNRLDHLTDDFYQLLHQLINYNGKISKSFFEYSPPMNNRLLYQNLFNSYTNFMWNEFDVNILLEIGCFLLKYRLSDIFITDNLTLQQKILGYFLEIIGIYYLSSNYTEFFQNSRSVDMIFPSPSLNYLYSIPSTNADQQLTFKKFLQALYDNGEIYFDIRQIKYLLQNESHQFLNKKLENRKIHFLNFLDKNVFVQQQNSCRSLKSICRFVIKMNIKQYPNDMKYLSLFPSINEQLQKFLVYENRFAFESVV